MKVIIFAGGKGQRMIEKGIIVSKHLLLINDETLIGRLCWQLIQSNIKEFYFTIPSKKHEIYHYLKNLNFIEQKIFNETIGYKGFDLKKVINNIYTDTKDLFIFMGDTVFQSDEIINFIQFSNSNQFDLIIGTTDDNSANSGMFINKDNFIISREISDNYTHSTGCFYINNKVLENININLENETSISKTLNNVLKLSNIKVTTFNFSFFCDINTPEAYEICNSRIK